MAIGQLRETRREGDGRLVCASARDQANMRGTVLPGERIPRVAQSGGVSRRLLRSS
ncbi:hypothetical protein [Pseudoxanthomonas sp. JBR18]|uniref:hypothetical protein n=1 Tax=Pseudoxanthomonas sp. JBR18 TaxID=2969308 RepID=UPI0023064F9D|nr:hypothetical protein [Pseudoxanthomonas sp. JBR18]WCE04102.1 hypothetical protein PJ250_18830 [Pseudoxanthomonas sp. JBR18]